jgi:hypothetical protein
MWRSVISQRRRERGTLIAEAYRGLADNQQLSLDSGYGLCIGSEFIEIHVRGEFMLILAMASTASRRDWAGFLKDKDGVPVGVQPHGFLKHGAVTQIDPSIEQFTELDFKPSFVK